MSVRRLALPVVTVALGGLALVAWSEARRTAAHNRRLENALTTATADAADARRETTAARSDATTLLAERDARIEVLEQETLAALARAEEVGKAIEAQRAEIETARAELTAHRAQRSAPMAEGVRLAVEAFEDCLRLNGYPNLRVLDAEALDDRVLRDVEVVERSNDGRDVTYFHAAKLTCVLERATGELVIRFEDGHFVRNGVGEDLPDGGAVLRYAGVDGPLFERRLPFLVVADGEYPADPARGGRAAEMDPLTRDRWAERLRTVLSLAQTGLTYEVGRFRTIDNGRFADAVLHAHDARKLLAQSIEAKSIAVEVDRELGTVSLLCEDGVLRNVGGDTTIPKSGYRMLLPGVTPAQASDAMLGFVVFRQ